MPLEWRFNDSCDIEGKCSSCKRWRPAKFFRHPHSLGLRRCIECVDGTRRDDNSRVQAKRYRTHHVKVE